MTSMKQIVVKLVLSAVGLLLQMAAGLFVIGVAQKEFGAPNGIEFPYGLLLLLMLAPLLISIWSTGVTVWRRIGGWAVGTIFTVSSFLVLRHVALRAYTWSAVYGDPYSLAALWPLAGVTVGCLLIGILSTWLVLRTNRTAPA